MELGKLPPEEAIKKLEEELAKNPKMREELERIKNQTLQDSKDALKDAVERQNQLAENLEKPLRDNPKGDPAAAQNFAQQAQQFAQQEVPQVNKQFEQSPAAAKLELARAQQAAKDAQQAAQKPNATPAEQMNAMAKPLEDAAKELRLSLIHI